MIDKIVNNFHKLAVPKPYPGIHKSNNGWEIDGRIITEEKLKEVTKCKNWKDVIYLGIPDLVAGKAAQDGATPYTFDLWLERNETVRADNRKFLDLFTSRVPIKTIDRSKIKSLLNHLWGEALMYKEKSEREIGYGGYGVSDTERIPDTDYSMSIEMCGNLQEEGKTIAKITVDSNTYPEKRFELEFRFNYLDQKYGWESSQLDEFDNAIVENIASKLENL